MDGLRWKDWHPELHGLVIRRAGDSYTRTLKGTKKDDVRPSVLSDAAENLLTSWRAISLRPQPENLVFSLDDVLMLDGLTQFP